MFLTLHEARAVERGGIKPRYSVGVAWHGRCDNLVIAYSGRCDIVVVVVGNCMASFRSTFPLRAASSLSLSFVKLYFVCYCVTH